MTKIEYSNTHGYPGFIRVIGDWLRGISMFNFFLIIFIYHLLVIFQGLDFNDEGFHLAFYQQIFNDPESVQYAFWGWLSGIVGGTFMKLFPTMGIWGIRFLGAVVSTGTMIIAFNLLKRYVHNGYLKVSMIMLSLFINEDAKNLYYNNLSAFIYFVTAWFLFAGLRDKKAWMILGAGFMVGLNIFTRLPNILGGGLIIAIWYYCFKTGAPAKTAVMKSLTFLTGILLALLCIAGVMQFLNHFTYFVGSLKMIFLSSNNASRDDGLNGAYGIGRLLKNNLIDYAKSLRFVFFGGALSYSIVYAYKMVQNTSKGIMRLFRIGIYVLLISGFVLVFTGWFTSYRLTEFFTGVSLISALILFDRKISNDYKLLAFIGGWILLVHPFGSSEGILTVVVYSMWISFPISVDYIVRQSKGEAVLENTGYSGSGFLKSSLNTVAFRNILWYLICLISAGCIYNVIRYPYLCDRHKRSEMWYSVDNKYMKAVFTSKGRAAAINELLEASRRYIQPGDYVLAYDCMPLYHFMTETKSYVRNPCIWFYTTGLFREEMKLAEEKRKQLPVIVRQLIKTTGEGSAWPETRPAENYMAFKRTQGKNKILDDFIKRHDYGEVWNNGEFVILVPRNK